MKVKVKQKLFRYKIKINIFMAENCHWKKISSWPRTVIEKKYLHALLKQSSKGNAGDWDEDIWLINMAAYFRNDSWKDVFLKQEMSKYVNQGLQREEILDFLKRFCPVCVEYSNTW